MLVTSLCKNDFIRELFWTQLFKKMEGKKGNLVSPIGTEPSAWQNMVQIQEKDSRCSLLKLIKG